MTSWYLNSELLLIQSIEITSNISEPQNRKTARVYFPPPKNAYEHNLSGHIKMNIKKVKAALKPCFHFVCLLFYFQESGIPELWQASILGCVTESPGLSSEAQLTGHQAQSDQHAATDTNFNNDVTTTIGGLVLYFADQWSNNWSSERQW